MNYQAAASNVRVPMMKDGKILYCAVLLHREPDGRGWKYRKEEIFTHGATVGEARWNIAHTILDPKKTTILVIGPAVGVKVDDEHGDKLSL